MKIAISIMTCLLMFVSVVMAIDPNGLALKWDANVESNLAGYNIYVSLTPGGPYNLIGTNEADNTEFMWYELPDNLDHYFVVTAFNDEGLESGYSNEVCGYSDENHDYGIACEDDFYTDDDNNGSDDKGCFINTIKGD